MPGPISPNQVADTKLRVIPEAVFEAINTLITQRSTGGTVVIKQGEILKLLEEKGLDRTEIFAKGWLNVEDAYSQAGWTVLYDKPGHNESYEASFTFSPK